MAKSYLNKVAGFYRSSHQRCFVKKGVLTKVFAKFLGKHLHQRLYFNKVAGLSCRLKKETQHKCFPVNLVKFLRTPFLQSTNRQLLLLLAFQRQPLEVFYEKRCSWKFCKIHRKTPVPGLFFNEVKTLAHVFSCEFCKIFKNTFE